MPCIAYTETKFRAATLATIKQANRIIADYAGQGYDLTLRQLYYQFVARGLIENSQRSYKNLGEIINDARLAGLIDWQHITDRTRNLRQNGHWSSPSDIMLSAAYGYAIDKWASQEYRPEVWVEKDALAGVVGTVCERLDVPYFSCRGYTSQSEMWVAAQRLLRYGREDKTPIIFHLGDHDPSGRDMTRDIVDRLTLFMGWEPELHRLALNMDQVEQYNPPPNPAKITDSRARAYIEEFGGESWELDALEPAVLADLIQQAILGVRDERAWEEAVAREQEERKQLRKVAKKWPAIVASLGNGHGGRNGHE